MTDQETLQKLTAKYEAVEARRRLAETPKERRDLYREASRLDRLIGKLKDKMRPGDIPIPVFVRNGDIFETENCYVGPTQYGSSLGDGCYWRKSGHH
jgi:hypothetical protein